MKDLEPYRQLLELLNQNHYQAYFIGGCVRNALFKRSFDDIDITTDAPSEALIEIFKDYKPDVSDINFLNISFKYHNTPITITPFRIEGEYVKHRYPSSVKPTSDIKLDAGRRDFTMNAIYMDAQYKTIDYYHGLDHIKNKQLVTVKNADRALSEDALRILRALRFMVVYDLKLDEDLMEAIERHASLVHRLSRNTLDKEIQKLQNQASSQQQTEYYKQLIKYNIKI